MLFIYYLFSLLTDTHSPRFFLDTPHHYLSPTFIQVLHQSNKHFGWVTTLRVYFYINVTLLVQDFHGTFIQTSIFHCRLSHHRWLTRRIVVMMYKNHCLFNPLRLHFESLFDSNFSDSNVNSSFHSSFKLYATCGRNDLENVCNKVY